MNECNHIITTIHEDECDVEGYAEWKEHIAKKYGAGSARDHFYSEELNNYCHRCGAAIDPDKVKAAMSDKDYTLREGIVGWRIKDGNSYRYHVMTKEDRDIVKEAMEEDTLQGKDGGKMEPLYAFGADAVPPDDRYTFVAFRTTQSSEEYGIVNVTKGRHRREDAQAASIAMFIKRGTNNEFCKKEKRE